MTADVLSIACDLITAERRLDELRAERNGICATCQPPKYEEATGRMWDQIELIEYTPPRSLAECAVKLCLLLSDQGLSVAGAGDDEVCLQQVLSFIEAAALQVGKNGSFEF